MATCPACRYRFQTLPDEDGMHACPRCGCDGRQTFHRHLDQCAQCRQRPMDLCPIGAALLRSAVNTRTDDDCEDDMRALREEAGE